MGKRPDYLIRHCPLCGTAMQASKSSEQAREFDTFECLICGTAIRPPEQPGEDADGGSKSS